MKKLLQFLIFIFLLINCAFAQKSFTDFKAGLLMPADAKTGFLGGVGFGKMVDENIGAGFEIGIYSKSYTEETTVDTNRTGNVDPVTYRTEIENSTIMIPLMFHLVYITQAGSNFDIRFTAGVGYELMWNSENNYKDGYEDTRFYSGFAWQIGAGASIPISRNADFFGEALYHGGSPSRDEGETALGLPERSEVDMSGMIFRLGIRLYNFGF